MESKIGTNTGHGHVWARPDGMQAKCGGPGMCAECSRDAALALSDAEDEHACVDATVYVKGASTEASNDLN